MPAGVDLAMAWLNAAQSARDAAVIARREHPRSSVSRAYYGGFSAASAVLHRLDPNRAWPGRPHLSHGETPGELWWNLSRALPNRVLPGLYKDQLSELYTLRVMADYRPLAALSGSTVSDAIDRCNSLVTLAERVVR